MQRSIVHLVMSSAARHANTTALMCPAGDDYARITYREMMERIRDVAHGLASAGITSGDRVGILSYNRPEWPISDLAVLALRGITVPVYHTLPPGQVAYILRDSGAVAVMVENEEQLGKIIEIREQCPALRMLVSFDSVDDSHSDTLHWADLLKRGRAHREEHRDFFDRSVESIEPGDLCSLVYTSGTTGQPKGVMLTQRGFVHDVTSSESVFGLREDDVFLSFLPLSHLYERVAGHWCPLYRGCTIVYARGIATVIDDLERARPTVMVSVPRLYEKIVAAVMERVEAGPRLKKRLFDWALRTGRRYHERSRVGRAGPLIAARYRAADRLVFRAIRKKLGGRFRFPIAGGAPLSSETLRFYEALGLNVVEGYGMTEAHLVVTLTPPGHSRYGSCGQPIPGVELRIAEDGEILVRGNTVMSGYYRKDELTREAIDAEGWLHTGDIGHIDADGYLYITDRKKNLLVTAGGKNVAPAPIENSLKTSRFIEDVCLIGDRRKFVSALVVPDFERLTRWARERGLPTADPRELARHSEVQDLFMEEIESRQKEFARYEQVKKCLVLEEPLSVEKGELTPSLKIRRSVVEKRFQDRIDDLYR
jgi:long-chain acyl-CoA synthetase